MRSARLPTAISPRSPEADCSASVLVTVRIAVGSDDTGRDFRQA